MKSVIEAAKLFFGNENLIDNDGCKQDGDRNDPRHGDLVLVGRLVALVQISSGGGA